MINIGIGDDLTTVELAETVNLVSDYGGDITFDVSKSDGTIQTMMYIERMDQIAWCANTESLSGRSEPTGPFVDSML